MEELLAQAFVFLAQAFDNVFVFLLIIAALVFATEPRWEKRKKIAIALFIAGMAAIIAKNVIMEPRPCLSIESLIQCPLDFSMPSGHAAVAFTLMIAFLGRAWFPFYWAFAILVAYSRFYVGVHTFDDIAAALVLAPIAYQATDLIWGAFIERNK